MSWTRQHVRPFALFLGWLVLVWWAVNRVSLISSGDDFLTFSRHLDVGWYLGIAEHGYHLDPGAEYQNVVFFPLLPWLARA